MNHSFQNTHLQADAEQIAEVLRRLMIGLFPEPPVVITGEHSRNLGHSEVRNPNPLHELCESGDTGDVWAYIARNKHKVDLEARNDEGFTPLHIACKVWEPNPLLVSVLLKAGANVNAQSDKGKCTALHFICSMYGSETKQERAIQIIDMIMSHPQYKGGHRNARDETPLHLVKYLKLAKHLVEKGEDINATNCASETLLHFISTESQETCTMEFLEYILSLPNVNVNIRDRSGLTPLELLCRNVYFEPDEIITRLRLFVEHGADLFAVKDNEEELKDRLGFGDSFESEEEDDDDDDDVSAPVAKIQFFMVLFMVLRKPLGLDLTRTLFQKYTK